MQSIAPAGLFPHIMAHTIIESEAFAHQIEMLVTSKGMNYLEAIIAFCEDRQLEPETVVPFIGDKMKTHLQREGVALHLLPKSSNTAILPLD